MFLLQTGVYPPHPWAPCHLILPKGRSMTWKTLTIKIDTDTNNTYNYTGKTKVALVELPTVNMFGVFFCAPFPSRILAWSLSYPGRISTLQKLKNLYIWKRVIINRPTPATQNALESVIRSWPRWMFCKAFKKHKLCSSRSILHIYLM